MGTKKNVMDLGVLVRKAKKKPAKKAVKPKTPGQLKYKIHSLENQVVVLLAQRDDWQSNYMDLHKVYVVVERSNVELKARIETVSGNLVILNDMLTKVGHTHQKEIARLIALIGDAESRTEQLSRAYNLMRGANEGLESKVKAMEEVPMDSQPIKPMDCCLSPQEVMEIKYRYERAIKGLHSENAELRTSVDVGEIMGIELRVRIEGLTDHIIYLNRLLTEE